MQHFKQILSTHRLFTGSPGILKPADMRMAWLSLLQKSLALRRGEDCGWKIAAQRGVYILNIYAVEAG